MDFFDKDFFDKDGVLLKDVWRFLSPTSQTMILFKSKHELAMGGPLIGSAGLLLENRVLIRLDGSFSEEVLWQTNGEYAALAKWCTLEGRHVNHKVSVIDLHKLTIGEFEETMFVKQFTRFQDKTVECEYYEKQKVKVFSGRFENLSFKSLRNINAG